MKIKDVIQESVYDLFTKRQAAKTSAASMAQGDRDTHNRGAIASTFKTNPGRTEPLSQQVAQGSVKEPLAAGVTVAKSNPLTLRYQKRDFLLNKENIWIMLGAQPKAASPEMQDFLNSEAMKL